MTNTQPLPHRRLAGSFCRRAVKDRSNCLAGTFPAKTPYRVKIRQLVNLHRQAADREAGVRGRQSEV